MINTHLEPAVTSSALSASEPRLLVLGLGNDILTDDAIGLLVVRRLECQLGDLHSVDFRETTEMGLALLDFIAGYDAVLIVDSIQTGLREPGSVHRLDAVTIKQLSGRTPHFLGLGDTLALGARLQIPMPRSVSIFAIEVADPFTLGTRISPRLQTAFESIVARIATEIQVWNCPPAPPSPCPPAALHREESRSS